MSPPDGATANLLGALALAVSEQTWQGLITASVPSGSDAAALSALHHFLGSPSLDQLHRVLGLTPSGAVRLVDRLEAAELVVRGPGTDGRTRAVTLTERGRHEAVRLSNSRTAYLDGLLSGLTPEELEALHFLLGKVMTNVVGAKDGGAWLCRLCDLEACGRADGHCPAANAAAAKYAGHPLAAPGNAGHPRAAAADYADGPRVGGET